jgi:hypothetical protein
MTKDEALQMCLEYIETDAHERKYVRHAIKQALAAPVQEPVAYVVWGENNVPTLTFSKPTDKYVFDALYYTTPPAAQPAPVQEENLYDLAVKADNGGQP